MEQHKVCSCWESGDGILGPSYPPRDGPAPTFRGVRSSRVVQLVKVCVEVRYTQGISKALWNSWDVCRKPELSESRLGSLR